IRDFHVTGVQTCALPIWIKANYFQTNIEGYGRKASPVLEFGGVAGLGPGLFFGAHIYNFTRARLSKISQDYLPTVIKAGISYRRSEERRVGKERRSHR